MEFIKRDIPLTRGVTTSSTSYSSAYSSSGTVTYKDYLELFGSTVAIKNGIILKPSSLGGVYGSVTGENITYLINQSDSLTEGWIFQTTNSSGTTKNVAGLNNSGKLNVNEFEILNDSKSISLSINGDGNMLVSGSDMTDKPVIQSIIDGVYQDLLINPNGGNVSINTEYSEGYQLNVNGTLKSHNITVNGGSHNNVLSTDAIDGSFKLNGQPLGARIYKIDELLAGTFSSDDISNSVNAYVGKNLLQRVTTIENTGSQPSFSGIGFVKVNGSVISYDNSTYLTGINSTQVVTALGFTPINTTDSRLTDARSASDVYSWAKSSSKPSYSWSEISSKPTVLSSFTNDLGNYGGWITGINSTQVVTALGYTPVNTTDGRLTDSRSANDVYAWAKASSKPFYSWSEIISRPTTLSAFSNDLGNYGGFVTGTPWTSQGYITSSALSPYQPLSTSINTSNIGSQSVSYASNSGWLNGNNTLTYGANGLNYFNMPGTSSNTANSNCVPTSDWNHILRMNHGNGNGYFVDLAFGLNNTSMHFRRITAGSAYGWYEVYHSGNFTPDNYLLKTDIYSWAKQSTKPSYSYSEISSKPTSLSSFSNDLGNYGNWVPWGNVTVSATASSVVQRDSNGYIYGTYINSSRGDETTAAASYIFDSGDGWLRKKPLSYAKSELVTSSSVINGLGYTPSANGHTHDYATHRGEGTNFIDYSYGMYDSYRGGWRTSNDLYVAYAYSAGSASSASNSDTVDGVHIWKGSQASYNSIGKDANTMYIII